MHLMKDTDIEKKKNRDIYQQAVVLFFERAPLMLCMNFLSLKELRIKSNLIFTNLRKN